MGASMTAGWGLCSTLLGTSLGAEAKLASTSLGLGWGCGCGGGVSSCLLAFMSIRLDEASDITGLGGSALLWVGSGMREVNTGDGTSALLGATGGSWLRGRLRVTSVRLWGTVVAAPSGAGVLCACTSGRRRPKRVMPGLGELSTCLEEMSMEISVRRDTGSATRPPESSTRRMLVFGERWLAPSLDVWSELREVRSWNRWLPVEVKEDRRGWVRRERGDECVEVSTSSTSNDLFRAARDWIKSDGILTKASFCFKSVRPQSKNTLTKIMQKNS